MLRPIDMQMIRMELFINTPVDTDKIKLVRNFPRNLFIRGHRVISCEIVAFKVEE